MGKLIRVGIEAFRRSAEAMCPNYLACPRDMFVLAYALAGLFGGTGAAAFLLYALLRVAVAGEVDWMVVALLAFLALAAVLAVTIGAALLWRHRHCH